MPRIRKFPKSASRILTGLVILVLVAALGYFAYTKGFLRGSVVDKIATPKTSVEKLPRKLKVLQAKVMLESDGQNVEVLAGHERELKDGDKLTTDLNGIAQVTYQSGTVVRIGQNSKITFQDSNTVVQDGGKVYVRFKKLLGIQEDFDVESSSTIAAVRGSAFGSIFKAGTDQKIIVTEDEAEVTPKDKDGKVIIDQKKMVNEDEMAVISRLTGVITISQQKLTQEEKDWLEFNKQLNESPDKDLISLFSTLKFRTPTPVPSTTASGSPVPTTAPLSSFSSMPGAGYHKGSVVTPVGTFPLACYGASKGSIRMVTDSASDSDCTNNCPVLPLDVYATRNGGVAAINGMYFCPADYPACADKINTFDTLFFNSRTKTYMNSANNVYSNIPFVGMNADHSVVFVGSSSAWGRDTSIIGGTAGNPMLMQGSNYAVNEAILDDKQRSVKSNRGAIALEGDMLYLCITQGATVPDSGKVYQTLGADYAINIDGGGSSALWVQGSYKYGPGRQIPTAIILAP